MAHIQENLSEFNNPELEKLLTAEQIKLRVRELGIQITSDYRGRVPILLGVLKGAAIFASDLLREIDLQIGLEFMAISSYGSSMRSSGEVRIIKDIDVPVDGRD
ncbi:MAG: phosphoribosyltransferase, partial [Pyrinomonadaceae bacterium]